MVSKQGCDPCLNRLDPRPPQSPPAMPIVSTERGCTTVSRGRRPAMRSAVAAAVAPAAGPPAAEPVKPPASERATVEATGCVGLEPPGEVAQALLAQLSGLMPLFVLGRRPAQAGPVPAPGVFLPVARAVPTVHVAVATRIHVGAADAPPADVPEVLHGS